MKAPAVLLCTPARGLGQAAAKMELVVGLDRRIGRTETGAGETVHVGSTRRTETQSPGRTWQARRTVIRENSLGSSFQTRFSMTQALPTGWSVAPCVSSWLPTSQFTSRDHVYTFTLPTTQQYLRDGLLSKTHPVTQFNCKLLPSLKKIQGRIAKLVLWACLLRC